MLLVPNDTSSTFQENLEQHKATAIEYFFAFACALLKHTLYVSGPLFFKGNLVKI